MQVASSIPAPMSGSPAALPCIATTRNTQRNPRLPGRCDASWHYRGWCWAMSTSPPSPASSVPSISCLVQQPPRRPSSRFRSPTQLVRIPLRLMPDLTRRSTQRDIWVSTGGPSVSQVTAGTGPGSLNGFVTTRSPTSGNSYGLTVSHGNVIFVGAGDSGAITRLDPASRYLGTGNGWPFTSAGRNLQPNRITSTVAGNTWIPNSGSAASAKSASLVPSALAIHWLPEDSTFLNSSPQPRSIRPETSGSLARGITSSPRSSVPPFPSTSPTQSVLSTAASSRSPNQPVRQTIRTPEKGPGS